MYMYLTFVAVVVGVPAEHVIVDRLLIDAIECDRDRECSEMRVTMR